MVEEAADAVVVVAPAARLPAKYHVHSVKSVTSQS